MPNEAVRVEVLPVTQFDFSLWSVAGYPDDPTPEEVADLFESAPRVDPASFEARGELDEDMPF